MIVSITVKETSKLVEYKWFKDQTGWRAYKNNKRTPKLDCKLDRHLWANINNLIEDHNEHS